MIEAWCRAGAKRASWFGNVFLAHLEVKRATSISFFTFPAS